MLDTKPLLLAGLLAALSHTAAAEGLVEVYQQAADSDPQLKSAAASLQANLEVKPQARALLLPNIGASADLNKNFAADTGAVNDADFTTNSIGVNLRQPLFREANRVQNRQAESQVDQAQADFLAAQQDLVLRVSEAYFGVLSALDSLTFTTAEKESIARQLEQANRRFEVGLITITDVHEAQARFDLAVAEEIRARNTLADAREALADLTGQFYDSLESLKGMLPLDLPDPADPVYWVNQAMTSNPELLSLSFSVETARENVALQKAGHLPTVDLVAGYSHSDSSLSGDTRGAVVGVEFQVSLFQGGAVKSRTREAAFRYEAARQNLEDQQRSVTRTVRNTYRGITAAISRVKALDQARLSNQSALEATEAGFDVGTRTIVDVLDAQRDLFAARRDFAQSRYDYILNQLRLERSAGTLTETDLQELSQWLDEPVSIVPGDLDLTPEQRQVAPRQFTRPVLPETTPLLPETSTPAYP